MSRGVWYGIAAQLVWGLSPVYWKQLDHLPATALISYRILWSLPLLAGLAWLARRRASGNGARPTIRVMVVYAVAAALLCCNWLIYVWAVTTGFIVEASLGYFITPLVSVALGVLVLRERLRPGQWTAVALASVGLTYLTVSAGGLPWIALALAGTFGVYGLVKKKAPLGSVQGLTAETGLLFLPAAAFLIWAPDHTSSGPLESAWLWLAGTGVLTVLPLLLFTMSVRRIPLFHLGILQYVAPTLQFLLGVLLYAEPFDRTQLVGYALVWGALLIFGAEGLYAQRARAMSSTEA